MVCFPQLKHSMYPQPQFHQNKSTKRLLSNFSWRTCHFVAHFLIVISTISWSVAAVSPPYTPTDNILLNCGAPSNTTSPDGREWETDSLSKFIPSPDIFHTSSTASTAYELIPSVDKTPYATARIFRSKFTYTIPVSKAGQKFLRLYFYPTNYSNGFDMTTSFFSVHSVNHTLLSNISALLSLQPPSLTLVKEFIITVDQNRSLQVTFIPSPNSYVFVNGIEVVSIPDKLYIKGNDNSPYGIKMVGQKTSCFVEDYKAIETLYRLNVGGAAISSTGDTGMFRSGALPYLLGGDTGLIPFLTFPVHYTSTTPSYTAPVDVYSTAKDYGA